MPDLPPGGVLLRVLYVSLDHDALAGKGERKSSAMPIGIGQVMEGAGVSEVIASDHSGFATGDVVLSSTGWRTHMASDGTGLRKLDLALGPVTTALGVLGSPGFAAYSGIMLIGKPKNGETVVVGDASGPVGSLVGQLAKMAGARAVGIAEGLEACDYIQGELGFDVAIDHCMPGLAERLARACARGIDIYFENVASGSIWDAVLPLLNDFARVPVCGWSWHYRGGGAAERPGVLAQTMRVVACRSLILRGFVNDEFVDAHYLPFLRTVSAGIADGRIRYREDITEGLENAPEAFLEMLEGRNFGKALVRVAP